jgi:hypothetical protein
MRVTKWSIAAAGASPLFFLLPAESAPVDVTRGLKSVANGNVQQVYRRYRHRYYAYRGCYGCYRYWPGYLDTRRYYRRFPSPH